MSLEKDRAGERVEIGARPKPFEWSKVDECRKRNCLRRRVESRLKRQQQQQRQRKEERAKESVAVSSSLCFVVLSLLPLGLSIDVPEYTVELLQ